MPEPGTIPPHHGQPSSLTKAERSSLTHSDFWIPEEEREKYKRALRALNEAGIPFVVTGAYAIYEYTGIYRETKDLDLFVEPTHLLDAARALSGAGFRTRLEQPHWLAKAMLGEHFVDLIFGMGNGVALVDDGWYRHSRPAILAAHPVRVAPAEELVWHRLFIGERHRQDMADIQHLILALGHRLNWKRLLERTGEHWPLLLAQLQLFAYVYPELPGCVPSWLHEELLERAAGELRRERSGERVTQGTLISKFSFAIDVNEWGFRDLREEKVLEMERSAPVREVAFSDAWDEVAESVERYRERWG
jgi:hypothetical protein